MSVVFQTEELHLAYRVVASMADAESTSYIERRIFEAAADLLRLAYLSRTIRDPLPGQTALPVS